MDTKLTLKLDENVIARAKAFAVKQKISLSQLIETYLDQLTSTRIQDEVSPTVKRLSGVIDADKLAADAVSYKKSRSRKYNH